MASPNCLSTILLLIKTCSRELSGNAPEIQTWARIWRNVRCGKDLSVLADGKPKGIIFEGIGSVGTYLFTVNIYFILGCWSRPAPNPIDPKSSASHHSLIIPLRCLPSIQLVFSLTLFRSFSCCALRNDGSVRSIRRCYHFTFVPLAFSPET